MHTQENMAADAATTKIESLTAKLSKASSKNSTQHAAIRSLKASVSSLHGAVDAMRADVGSLGAMIPDLLPQFSGEIARWKRANSSASEQLAKNYTFEVSQRRYYFNRIQELKGNIRVYCRVRPLSDKERAKEKTSDIITFPSEGAMVSLPLHPTLRLDPDDNFLRLSTRNKIHCDPRVLCPGHQEPGQGFDERL